MLECGIDSMTEELLIDDDKRTTGLICVCSMDLNLLTDIPYLLAMSCKGSRHVEASKGDHAYAHDIGAVRGCHGTWQAAPGE